MKKDFRDTVAWKLFRTFIQILLIVLVIYLFIAGYNMLISTAHAETKEAYVLCDGYVNIRQTASKKSTVIGRFECGEPLTLDGKSKNGFLHCTNLALESDEGWIHSGYVVYDEPISANESATVISKGRLAARNRVNGNRIRWLKPQASVKVLWWSNDWCVTNCGYIQSKYLEPEGE